jgi:hypothetical protein
MAWWQPLELAAVCLSVALRHLCHPLTHPSTHPSVHPPTHPPTLSYDYRFKEEDDVDKVVCQCGAPTCKGTLN